MRMRLTMESSVKPTQPTTDRFYFWTEQQIHGRSYADLKTADTIQQAMTNHRLACEFLWAADAEKATVSALWEKVDDGVKVCRPHAFEGG